MEYGLDPEQKTNTRTLVVVVSFSLQQQCLVGYRTPHFDGSTSARR